MTSEYLGAFLTINYYALGSLMLRRSSLSHTLLMSSRTSEVAIRSRQSTSTASRRSMNSKRSVIWLTVTVAPVRACD